MENEIELRGAGVSTDDEMNDVSKMFQYQQREGVGRQVTAMVNRLKFHILIFNQIIFVCESLVGYKFLKSGCVLHRLIELSSRCLAHHLISSSGGEREREDNVTMRPRVLENLGT